MMTSMNTAEIKASFDDVFDQGVLAHGFTDYLRDYDVFINVVADPRTGIAPAHLRYRFTHCVRATAMTSVPPEIWKRSLDPRLIGPDLEDDVDGYFWGVRWQVLYPGMQLVVDSPEAARWSSEVGISFHEALVEGNGHQLSLVFSDLIVKEIDVEQIPFTTSG